MKGYDILNAVINVHAALEPAKGSEGKYFVIMECYSVDDLSTHTFALMKYNHIGKKPEFIRTDSELPISPELERVMFKSQEDAMVEVGIAIDKFIETYLCNVTVEQTKLGYDFIHPKPNARNGSLASEQNFVEVSPMREFCAWILGEYDGKRIYFNPNTHIFNSDKEVKLSLIGLDKLFTYLRENKMSGDRIFIHEYD